MNEFETMKRGEWGLPNVPTAKKESWNAATGTEALVCDDIAARQKLGIAKYGTTVCANPLELKQWLQHAYEEAPDQAIYLKRAIQELDQ